MQYCNFDGKRLIVKAIDTFFNKGLLILLEGTLGSGKTTFASMLINHISLQKEIVTSPTFSIIKEYDSKFNIPIFHFDLYRVEKEIDIWNLNIEECISSGISIIEWPEVLPQVIKDMESISIKFEQIGENFFSYLQI